MTIDDVVLCRTPREIAARTAGELAELLSETAAALDHAAEQGFRAGQAEECLTACRKLALGMGLVDLLIHQIAPIAAADRRESDS